ncbi:MULTISPECIES: zinc finger domain-containing protein [Streptomyces]|uniref:DNA-binding phage zinc finger domain-containing protein n=1 Tax=Streptomyces evansiae TaxID=3075535 RepID=A0ABU2QZU6_9ACTN|nr:MULTISPECIES: hypothetical protein [unclassified Streptomyces]MDT0409900.1 hypothetical protein [Streptomyces sp. DSM 41979]MYQ60011.1 hypothetical protein [Streptomyces sp. SID4926]SCE40116.1 hypothetical protein GA0115252_146410 [Streptomyces sp. DfronAA-171]
MSARRDFLLAAIQGQGPAARVSTASAARLMAASPWPTTGRNTARKDLGALVARGVLRVVESAGRTSYQLSTKKEGGMTVRFTDADRVLGQIERGEVRVGPDAAREIAARHEARYGSVWAKDRAWAEAVADLGPAKRSSARVDHAAVAEAARRVPGEWVLVGEYRNSVTAASTASSIRTGNRRSTQPFYGPGGSFEARVSRTEGGTRVEARYVGAAQGEEPARTFPQLRVACPACGSAPGALCTSHDGTRVRRHDVHQARRAAWAKGGAA